MNNFRRLHAESTTYHSLHTYPNWRIYQNSLGWNDHWLGNHLVYTHRKNHYTPSTFTEKLHAHEYYELLIPRRGEVAFFCDDRAISIKPGSIILFKPGNIHTARLLTESDYERYAFFFDREAFDLLGQDSGLLDFITRSSNHFIIPVELEDTMYGILKKIDSCLSGNSPENGLLAYSYIIQLFYLINRHAAASGDTDQSIPQNVMKIKQYVDTNYLTLSTTTEIAEHFFYRREYVSYLFKEYFNTNLSDYLTNLKIQHSKKMLAAGSSVTEACYQSGFHNMSTFNNCFRNLVHMNPSAYRKNVTQKMSIGNTR